ncbi:MAG: hypothetical protein ACLTYN_02970 [Dysosmobacter welbionis]
MRMNGSCAGGTGAFIDEIATLLNVPADEFRATGCPREDRLQHLRPLRRVCQDRHPALADPGGRQADIALSTFHAIAKQTIGGLSQGLELTAPIIFEGSPLTFNPRWCGCLRSG